MVGSSTTNMSTEDLLSTTLTGSVRSTRPPMHDLTTMDSKVIRSTGHVFTFFDHSVMQSRQNMCSQACGVPTCWSVNRSRQMEHLSELPSELSEAKPEAAAAAAGGAVRGDGSLSEPEDSLSSSESLSWGRRRRRVPAARTELPLLSAPSDSLTTCNTPHTVNNTTPNIKMPNASLRLHTYSKALLAWSRRADTLVAVGARGGRHEHDAPDPAPRGPRRALRAHPHCCCCPNPIRKTRSKLAKV